MQSPIGFTCKPLLKLSLLLGLLAVPALADTSSYKNQAVELLRELVSYRTAQGHGQVPVMAELLRQKFLEAGFNEKDVHLIPLEPETASLVVRYKGDGSGGRPILLMAHMDVVEALKKDWENDPFTMLEKEGRLYGRGVSDNKAGVATLTNTFLRLKREGFLPTRDLIIAFSGDEETGMQTIKQLTTRYFHLVDAEFALNADSGGGVMDEDGKPISYNLQAAEKSYMTFKLTVRNPGGHSSVPRADNAIYELAAGLGKLQAFEFPVRSNAVTREYFNAISDSYEGEIATAMLQFSKNPNNSKATAVLSTYPELAAMLHTTCVATMLEAGHAENALPQSASATVNCRVFPGVSVAQIKARLTDIMRVSNLEIEVLGDATASPDSPVIPQVLDTVRRSLQVYYPDIPVVVQMAPYATDGKHTRAAGIPTYGVSGVFYDPEGGFEHGLNERVNKAAYLVFQDYWYDLLKRFAGN